VPESHRRLAEQDEALIRDLYPSLRRFAGVVRPPEVEPDDLLQEAFYRVLRRGRLSDLPYPVAYMRRTLTNLASNHRRSLGRRRKALTRLRGSEIEHPHYPSDIAELLELSPRARVTLYMRVIEGHSFTEIAEVLGCTEVAARGLEARAKRSLRAVVQQEERDATA
jgi:RNA polymerase sigma-70 factor (ECF subfamily)